MGSGRSGQGRAGRRVVGPTRAQRFEQELRVAPNRGERLDRFGELLRDEGVSRVVVDQPSGLIFIGGSATRTGSIQVQLDDTTIRFFRPSDGGRRAVRRGVGIDELLSTVREGAG